MDIDALVALEPELERYIAEIEPGYGQAKSAAHLRVYMRGQLSGLERKSVEPIAAEAGVPVRTLQEFFSIHSWDANELRANVRRIVARDHATPDAIGIIDETSYAKSGKMTVGVQRQYCGASGKIDNCVVTVHLGYAADDFHTLVDDDIYLPKSWTDDRARCRKAGVPDAVAFRTKWRIALDLIDRSRKDGIALRWITADEGYGEVPAFLRGLDERGLLYVVEIPRSIRGTTPAGLERGREPRRAEALWGRGGPSWVTYRVKDTTRGPLVWRARATRFRPSWSDADRWLIVAENPLTGETKYFLSNAAEDVPIETLLAVAFSRWRVERLFQDAKTEIGLDHFEMRLYSAVQRHLAISMASLLFLYRARRSLGGTENIAIGLATQAGHADAARPAAHAQADPEATPHTWTTIRASAAPAAKIARVTRAAHATPPSRRPR